MYSYKGLTAEGKEVRSSISSDSVAAAKQKLRAGGVMLIEIREQKADAMKQKSTVSLTGGVSVSDLALMTRQFATLIKANIQVVDALAALTDQMDNQKLRMVLSEVRQKVNEGASLAKAFSEYPKIFNNIYQNMVDAGEASGNLDIVLLRLADFTEAQVKLKNKIKGAMTYPIIMIVVGSIMMGIIFVVVIPKITKIFITMKKKLPLNTQICIWISNFIQHYWWAVIIGIVFGIYSFKKYIQTQGGEKRWHYLLLRLPMIRELTVMINVSRFCSTLATLLNSGVPILTSMSIVSNLVSNVHMKKAVLEARTNVVEGASMTGPLKKSGLFPPIVTHMITIGEQSGELEPMLKIIAENYEEQVNAKLSGLTSMLEPIMLVLMGGVVGFIVFSVIAPMMELNSFK